MKKQTIDLCEISEDSFVEWLEMGLSLWPQAKKEDLEREFRMELKSGEHKHFIVKNDCNEFVGFINLSIRNDYVQGSLTSPVVYIEGIFVKAEFRNQGIAKQLVVQAEKWAQEKGYTEIGSDTELSNVDSQQFHIKVGFEKAGVIVHFVKKIEDYD